MIHSCLQYYVIHLSSGSSYISKLKTGNFFIIPTGVLHRYAADERSPWTIYWVHFKGINTKLMINNFLSRKESYCAYVEYQESRVRLFEGMYSNLEMGYSSDKLIYANMCLPHFLSSFIYKDNYNISPRKQSKNQINQSINYMEQHFDKMLSLQEMATSVNLSASPLFLCF